MRARRRLSREEEIECSRQVREDGNIEARDTLVLHTSALVGWIARKYLWSGIEYEDLVQEGTVGLIIAAQRWDSQQGFGFSTFAKWWIFQTISRLILENGIIRIQSGTASEMHKVRRVMSDFTSKHGRPPSEAEITASAGISLAGVRRALRALRIQVISFQQSPSGGMVDAGRLESGDWSSNIEDYDSLRADHIIEAREELDAACNRLNNLVEVLYTDEKIQSRHRDMFMRFYGLDGTLQTRTFEATGEYFDTTKGAVCIAIQRIWVKLQAAGLDLDHEAVLADLARIAALERLSHKRVSVS